MNNNNPAPRTIKARKGDVSWLTSVAFPEYSGRRFAIRVSPTVYLSDLHWAGGTRNEYRAVRMDDGAAAELETGTPWAGIPEGTPVEIPVGVAIVEHSYFCGKDCGITVHIHPDNAARLLPRAS